MWIRLEKAVDKSKYSHKYRYFSMWISPAIHHSYPLIHILSYPHQSYQRVIHNPPWWITRFFHFILFPIFYENIVDNFFQYYFSLPYRRQIAYNLYAFHKGASYARIKKRTPAE